MHSSIIFLIIVCEKVEIVYIKHESFSVHETLHITTCTSENRRAPPSIWCGETRHSCLKTSKEIALTNLINNQFTRLCTSNSLFIITFIQVTNEDLGEGYAFSSLGFNTQCHLVFPVVFHSLPPPSFW